MQCISLTYKSLSQFISKGPLSELGGSSKYHVFDSEIVLKEKHESQHIENQPATMEYLEYIIKDNMADKVMCRIKINWLHQLIKCTEHKFTSELENTRLELLQEIARQARTAGNEFPIKRALIHETILNQQSRYNHLRARRSKLYRINRTRVKQKIYALFNLKCSQKFIAFYSVSFPIDTSDDMAFVCWNYWLTLLRKQFNLTNYIWVSERQKNGTLHYHMLTNNYMPILQINRGMAIIINNQVKEGNMQWSGSCLEKYNGVDVDSIFNSKRHKKTGKNLNPSEVRNWISLYVTKYVIKNTAEFTHLCWHCSRSVSMLFTTQVYEKSYLNVIDLFLPPRFYPGQKVPEHTPDLYVYFRADFNETWVFKFEPPPKLYEKIKMYNDWIFVEDEPYPISNHKLITFKTTKL